MTLAVTRVAARRAPVTADASSPRTASRRTGSRTAAPTTSSATARCSRSTTGNVGKLGLAWSYATGTTRGLQATPIVVDGRMYATGVWSVVYALDARTGKELWNYDPRSAARVGALRVLRRRQSRRRAVERRGVRRHARRAPDCARRAHRQEALGSQHDRPHQALHDHGRAARRQGQGADRQRRRRVRRARLLLGLRRRPPASWPGASTPCPAIPRTDSRTPSSQRPRRPGPASGGSAAVAARSGTRWPTTPTLDTLYVGTGNGSPWARSIRSPGGGDNLYLSSILALDPGHRPPQVALPDDAGGQLGLHRDAAHDPRGPRASTASRARC